MSKLTTSDIQNRIDQAHQRGGGRVIIPAGTHDTIGSLELKSRVELHLEPGARIVASPDIADYHDLSSNPDFAKADFCRFWIWAADAEDIAITGTGVLDGNGAAFTEEVRPERTVPKNPRSQGIGLLGCRSVRIRDIRLENFPSWALRPAGCEDVVIEGITIRSDVGMVNTDGIDPDCCQNVRISNCDIRCGDDGICIKCRREMVARYGASSNILISNCVIQSSCCAVKIGTETCADIRDIVVSGCQIRGSHRGLGIDGRDASIVENILFSDCIIETKLSHPVWWQEGEPIYICPLPRPEQGPEGGSHVKNIRFHNLLIRAETGIFVMGNPDHPPENLHFESVRLEISKHSPFEVGRFDPRPCPTELMPPGSLEKIDSTPWGSLWKHPTPGFYLAHVDGCVVKDCEVVWSGDLSADYGHALEAHSVANFDLVNLKGSSAHPESLPATQIA
ncbi:MAG: glycoside hydrolase family 28 protein [Opitutales bacterium]